MEKQRPLTGQMVWFSCSSSVVVARLELLALHRTWRSFSLLLVGPNKTQALSRAPGMVDPGYGPSPPFESELFVPDCL